MAAISETELKCLEAKCDTLQRELELKSKLFDYHIVHDKDCEISRILYTEIKKLRSRLYELSIQLATDYDPVKK
jgi:hypothetical protein